MIQNGIINATNSLKRGIDLTNFVEIPPEPTCLYYDKLIVLWLRVNSTDDTCLAEYLGLSITLHNLTFYALIFDLISLIAFRLKRGKILIISAFVAPELVLFPIYNFYLLKSLLSEESFLPLDLMNVHIMAVTIVI